MNFSRSFSRGVSAGLFAGVAAIALMPSAVAAQAIEEDTTTLDNDADLTDGEPDVAPAADNDVIIVTATKRAQTLQETPVSVSVTTGETLERAEIRDLLDLQTVAPSLRVSQLQSGIISVVTREPQFDFGGSAALTYGNYDNIVVRGDVTGPITDSVAFSLEGNYNTRDGYVDVVNLDEKINDRNRYGARAQLLFDNGGALRVRAIGDYSKIDENCCFAGNVLAGPTFAATRAVGGNVAANDPFSYEAYLNQLPTNDIESYGGSLQAGTAPDVGLRRAVQLPARRLLFQRRRGADQRSRQWCCGTAVLQCVGGRTASRRRSRSGHSCGRQLRRRPAVA